MRTPLNSALRDRKMRGNGVGTREGEEREGKKKRAGEQLGSNERRTSAKFHQGLGALPPL